ncbi:Gfo/Idh/MocA family protein [Granulosicoccus sp. 3-233]|uniref:Gfo/Idh/MocA family protein n=1 Tax=Granulosicoccus sp. 3-233 TaxID=3417969 RepID=UPI003D33E46E
MDKLNVGIIGCGNISSTYLSLAPLFRTIDVKAVADIDAAVAQERANEYGVRAQGVDELIAADDVDIIVNLTVPAAHHAITRRILEGGKHAYSEKPLVLSLEDGRQLQDLAQAKGLRIGSAPDTFLGGAHQAARSAVDSGRIGNITGATCHFMNAGMENWHPNPDFFFLPGGGPVLDMGPYYMTNLVQFMGPVRAVSAMASTGSPTRTIGNGPREGESINVSTPTNYQALLEFHGGAIVTLGSSWDVRAHRHANMELYGTTGTLFVPDPNFFGGTVELANGNGDVEVLSNDGHPFAVPNTEDSQEIPRANYRCAGLADMADSIIRQKPHRCNLELALHVVDILTSIQTSAESRQWVEISTTCERPEACTSEQAQALLTTN